MFSLEELYSVKGKVVVVTGGGTGLGKSIAAGFVENGAKVYISARRKEVLEKAAKDIEANAKQGGSVHIIVGDVSTKDGCTQIADAIKAKEDKLDVLINCAGVIKGYKQTAHPFDVEAVEKQMLSVDDDDFNYQNQINVNGVYFLTAALVSLLRKGTDPSVVVIASIAGVLNQHSMGSLTYGASKAATLHLGKLLAGKLSPLKIRVNTVLPGIFPSEMTGVKQDSGSGLAEAADKAVKRSAAGRGGEPHEIVGPILMLSSRGGSFMTGGVITVDGGRCMNAGIHDGIKIPDELLTYT